MASVYNTLAGPLDVQGIVEAIIHARKQPIRNLEQTQLFYNAKKSAFQELNTRISAVESSLFDLNTYAFGAKKASVNQADVLAAEATFLAQAGSHSLFVRQLAQAQSTLSGVFSSADAELGDGTFSMTQGEAEFSFATAGKTLNQLKDAINSSDLSVQAVVIRYGTADYRLQISATSTGTDQVFSISDDGVGSNFNQVAKSATHYSASASFLQHGRSFSITDGDNSYEVVIDSSNDSLESLAAAIKDSASDWLTAAVRKEGANYYLELATLDSAKPLTITDDGSGLDMQFARMAARDAIFNINTSNPADAVTRSSNTITDVIEGVTLNLKKTEVDSPVILTVATDNAATLEKVKAFATAFNSAIDFLSAQFTYNEETGRSGILSGDSTARQAQMELLSAVTSRVQGIESGSGYEYLANVGVTLDKNGHLQINESELNSALNSDPTAVQRVFKDVGTSSTSELSYVSRTSDTVAGRYTVYYDAGQDQWSFRYGSTIEIASYDAEKKIITGLGGNSKGLMVMVSDSGVDGERGEIYFTRGIAETLRRQLYEFSFPYNGSIAREINTLDDQVERINLQIKKITERLQNESVLLIMEFTRANQALLELEKMQQSIGSWGAFG